MSLITTAKAESTYTPVPEGTFLAVCNLLVDIGEQVNEKFGNSSRKVVIGWEIPEETTTICGKEVPMTITQTYTNSLSKKANLRADLQSWRGRDFTDEELDGFNLRNIVGTSCLLNVIHKESGGRVYANISSIMALPKGMPRGSLSGEPLVFDLDEATLEEVNELPPWLQNKVKASKTYAEKQNQVVDEMTGNPYEEITEDGELPF